MAPTVPPPRHSPPRFPSSVQGARRAPAGSETTELPHGRGGTTQAGTSHADPCPGGVWSAPGPVQRRHLRGSPPEKGRRQDRPRDDRCHQAPSRQTSARRGGTSKGWIGGSPGSGGIVTTRGCSTRPSTGRSSTEIRSWTRCPPRGCASLTHTTLVPQVRPPAAAAPPALSARVSAPGMTRAPGIRPSVADAPPWARQPGMETTRARRQRAKAPPASWALWTPETTRAPWIRASTPDALPAPRGQELGRGTTRTRGERATPPQASWVPWQPGVTPGMARAPWVQAPTQDVLPAPRAR